MAGLIQQQLPPEEDAQEPGEPPENTPADMQEDAAEGEPEGEAGDPDGATKLVVFVERLLADEKNGLMKSIAQKLKDSTEPTAELARTAYDIVAMADEKTGGMVPDEDLAGAAAEVLGIVAEIAETVGIKIGGREIAGATNLMIRRFMEENGDVEGLQAMQNQDVAAIGDQLDQQAAQEVPA